MGAPIARRLSRRFEVGVFDIVPERSRVLGGGTAASAGELASASDVLVAVLPGAAEQRSVLLGDPQGDGLIGRLAPGALLLDLTSGDPDVSRALGAAAAARGSAYVAAPMGGGPTDASAGTLRFFAAGAVADVERARGILEALCARPDDVAVVGEDPGAAQVAKLLVNGLWFGQALLVAEAMLAAAGEGVAPSVFARLLAGSAADSVFARDHLPLLLEGDYMESFGLHRVVEELDAVVRIAGGVGDPGLLAAVRDRHAEALERYGPVPGELLAVRLLEERAGRVLRGE